MNAVLIIITVVQLLVALALILIVLFQSGKSQGLSGASNPLPRVLYHKKFEKFVNIWGISSPTRAQRPSIVYFITFRLVCQPGKSTFFSR